MKTELVWPSDYAGHVEAMRDIAHNIANFYNSVGLHCTLVKQPIGACEITWSGHR